jgi:hypothetical protein
MVQFLSINFVIAFLQFLLGFSKFPVFCVTLFVSFIWNSKRFEMLWTALFTTLTVRGLGTSFSYMLYTIVESSNFFLNNLIISFSVFIVFYIIKIHLYV